MKRTVTINENPKIELAIRELETRIEDVLIASSVESNEVVINTIRNHNMGIEDAVNVDTTFGARTLSLSTTPVSGRKYRISNRGSNILTVNGMGKSINGASTLIISNKYSTADLQFNGTEWVII